MHCQVCTDAFRQIEQITTENEHKTNIGQTNDKHKTHKRPT